MSAPLLIVLNREEDRTLQDLSCADSVPQPTKQRVLKIWLNAYGWNLSAYCSVS